ncbi:VOC family protein [Caldibacillus lycopersici]|uniref:VOC family protein n=1 Tax=Perspicuibacillus lycopersici TaxID=1325689 RepID=A0AAE3LPB6_9BACI|nr:VOC family protein [Perspicuibacillus lycopersici]MCU9614772.1 VOC family protein [Perspicuibacillus lycopersici]
MTKITTFLMFEGRAEEAINLYTSVFHNSELKQISRYGANEDGPEGSVMQAVFTLNGQEFMCIDSFVHHSFSFTPSISLFVTFDKESELDRVYSTLSEGGSILMPLDSYPFSKKFAWISDKFGVTWQLSLGQ